MPIKSLSELKNDLLRSIQIKEHVRHFAIIAIETNKCKKMVKKKF